MMYSDIAWLCRPAKAVSCAAGGKISRPMDTAAGQRLCFLCNTKVMDLPASSIFREVPRRTAAGDRFEQPRSFSSIARSSMARAYVMQQD